MKRTTTLVFCMVLFVSVGNSFAVEAVSGDSTRIPKPPIKTREDWYEDTNMLCQYEEKKYGESISYKVLGKTRYRIFRYMSYNELLGAGEGELKKVLKWIVIHHPQFRVTKAKGDPVEEMRLIRNSQIIDSSYVFSDMAYHFGIATDGTIFEGVPLTHMGRHAGKTTQSEDMKKKNLPLGMMMSPDFGAIGIVLAGNFDLDEPTEAQVESLVWLLSWLKQEYDIPDDGILYHGEVFWKILTAGFTPTKKEPKSCPGDKFCAKDYIIARLPEDTEVSCEKNILFGFNIGR